jgi:hypothetical protein
MSPSILGMHMQSTRRTQRAVVDLKMEKLGGMCRMCFVIVHFLVTVGL